MDALSHLVGGVSIPAGYGVADDWQERGASGNSGLGSLRGSLRDGAAPETCLDRLLVASALGGGPISHIPALTLVHAQGYPLHVLSRSPPLGKASGLLSGGDLRYNAQHVHPNGLPMCLHFMGLKDIDEFAR